MLTLGILGDIFTHGLRGLFLLLDSIVYWVVSELYELFYSLATHEFFTKSAYEEIANRCLVVVGVVMLFYLAYALLKALVNPDELNKITSKIVTNLVISLILIVVVPTIFTYAYRIQNIVLSEGIIDKLVFGELKEDEVTEGVDPNENFATNLTKVGRATAMTFFESFAVIPGDAEMDYPSDTVANWADLRKEIIDGEESFLGLTYLVGVLADYPDETSYTPIMATVCGIFLIYVIFSFCIDMGIRVVKLAFYQIISPVPILMRIVPEKKSVFDNWVKATLATYLEVFIRIFIMYIIAFLASKIIGNVTNFEGLNVFGRIIVLMGLFAFAKQAPKLIGDMIGVNSGDLKLGIREKIAGGGGFIAGAAIGGGITAGMRNATNTYQNVKNAQGFGNKFKAAAGGIVGVGTGALSGAGRSGYGARSAKNERDMRSAASQGAQAVVQNRQNRENYRANHSGRFGVTSGHIADTWGNVKSWATGTASGILGKVEFEQNFKDSYKDYEAIFENPKYNAMKSQLDKYEALKASGVEEYQGKNVEAAIDELKGNMLKARMEAIHKNEQSSAYAMYNIAQLARKNPEYARQAGINEASLARADNLIIRNNEVVDKKTGKKIEAQDLFEMIEGSSLQGVTSRKIGDTTKFFDSSGNEITDFAHMAKNQAHDGLRDQKFNVSKALRRDQMSVEYKEAKRQQDARNNNNH